MRMVDVSCRDCGEITQIREPGELKNIEYCAYCGSQNIKKDFWRK